MKATIQNSWLYAALILGLGFSTLGTATAAPVFEPSTLTSMDDDKGKDAKEKAEDGEEAEEEDEEEKTRWYAIVGGDIYPGTGAILRNATMLCKDGKIVEIGYDVWIPEDAETLDATGHRVYPEIGRAHV